MKKLLLIVSIFTLIACGSKSESKNTQTNLNGDQDTTKGSKTEILDDARPSPLKRTTGKIGNVKTVIQWGSPSVKGREIWGMIVPYDEVWRSGANEATTVEFDKDVVINGQELAAGKYGFYSIPREGEWTVIFNSIWNAWGAFEYDEKKDVLRVNVAPEDIELSETLEYVIEEDGFALQWEKLKVKLNVQEK